MSFVQRTLDSSSLIVLFLAVVLVSVIGKPVQRGFWCHDQRIRYPLREDTVSSTNCVLIAIIFPPLISFVVNYGGSWNVWKSNFWRKFRGQSYVFFYGVVVNGLLTQVTKFSVGRLRPNFMDFCRPLNQFNETFCASGHEEYISNFECAGTGYKVKFQDYRLSFFSGHSSFTAHGMIFLVLMLHRQMKGANLVAIRTLLQCAAMLVACYVGYTRISDNWHHWEDVTVGLFVGTFVALVIDHAFREEAIHVDYVKGHPIKAEIEDKAVAS